jgi:hypothetical protein
MSSGIKMMIVLEGRDLGLNEILTGRVGGLF